MRIVAIIAAFNEADVIAPVVGDLIAQGVQVYFLDDGSTDGTAGAVEPYVGRGVIAIERVPSGGAQFDWERILRRKTELARELDADWFIHHDADEFRESPWPHLSLADAIGRVDAMGYNAIDFASLDFWPVHDRFRAGEDVRESFRFYEERAPYDRVQIRCWKKADDVDLAATGGHDAQFAGRNVFPLRFVLRHYPIRGQAHGERKVFRERRDRFRDEERARGWHVQYDDIREGAQFIRDPTTLIPYDADTVRIGLMLRHRGVEQAEAAVEAGRSALARATSELEAVRSALAREMSDAGSLRGYLAQRTIELREKEAQLAVRNAQASELTAAIERLNSVLESRNRELTVRNAQFDELTADIERQRAVLDRRDRELAVRNAQFDELTPANENLHRILEHRDRELATRAAQYDEQSAEIARLRQSIENRSAEIERWRAALDEATRRLDAIERSASWRLTAPMRRLLHLLRGR